MRPSEFLAVTLVVIVVNVIAAQLMDFKTNIGDTEVIIVIVGFWLARAIEANGKGSE